MGGPRPTSCTANVHPIVFRSPTPLSFCHSIALGKVPRGRGCRHAFCHTLLPPRPAFYPRGYTGCGGRSPVRGAAAEARGGRGNGRWGAMGAAAPRASRPCAAVVWEPEAAPLAGGQGRRRNEEWVGGWEGQTRRCRPGCEGAVLRGVRGWVWSGGAGGGGALGLGLGRVRGRAGRGVLGGKKGAGPCASLRWGAGSAAEEGRPAGRREAGEAGRGRAAGAAARVTAGRPAAAAPCGRRARSHRGPAPPAPPRGSR
jgi:hypothetical protein